MKMYVTIKRVAPCESTMTVPMDVPSNTPDGAIMVMVIKADLRKDYPGWFYISHEDEFDMPRRAADYWEGD